MCLIVMIGVGAYLMPVSTSELFQEIVFFFPLFILQMVWNKPVAVVFDLHITACAERMAGLQIGEKTF